MIIISSCWYCEDTLTSGNHQSVWLMRITMSHQKNFILTSCWLYKTLFLTLLGWCGFFNQFRGLESCELTMLVDNFVWRHETWWSVPGYNEGTEIFCHHIVFQTSPHSPARLSDCTAIMTRSHNHVIKFLIIENNIFSIPGHLPWYGLIFQLWSEGLFPPSLIQILTDDQVSVWNVIKLGWFKALLPMISI